MTRKIDLPPGLVCIRANTEYFRTFAVEKQQQQEQQEESREERPEEPGFVPEQQNMDWTGKIYTYDQIIELMDEKLTKEEKRGLKSAVKGKSTRAKQV